MQRSNISSITLPYFDNKKIKLHFACKYKQQTTNEWLMFDLMAPKIPYFKFISLF